LGYATRKEKIDKEAENISLNDYGMTTKKESRKPAIIQKGLNFLLATEEDTRMGKQ